MKQHYIVRQAKSAPVFNDDWEGAEWANANILNVSIFREGSGAFRPQTELKLLYNENSIFCLFRVQDRYVRAIRSGFQGDVCRDSCVELFIKPKKDSGYFNFEFNCGGAMLCYYIIDHRRIKGSFANYVKLKDDELKKIKIYHSLPEKVDPEIKEDTEWFLGFEIPLDFLASYAGDIGTLAGQEWTANSYKCASDTSNAHWASWNPITETNFHLPECFGTLEFE